MAQNRFQSPDPGSLGRMQTWLANSRALRTWRRAEAVEYLCLQDAAIAEIDGEVGLAHAEISLPIALATVVPMATTAYEPGDWLRRAA